MLAEISSILQFLFRIVEAFTGIFSEKRDDMRLLKENLVAIESELRKAIAERRVTDAAALRARRDELKEMIKSAKSGKKGGGSDRVGSVDVRTVSNAVFAAALLAACTTGCMTSKPKQNLPLVVGERIIFVDPGQQLVVPPLLEPASTWYLIDDCALCQWLGISLDGTEAK